jgi:hypothetical protein
MKHGGVAAMCIIGGGIMFSFPYFIQARTVRITVFLCIVWCYVKLNFIIVL